MTGRIPLLFAVCALLGAGCGDDATVGDAGPRPDAMVDAVTTDTGPLPTSCPSGDAIPDREGFMGPCCYRKSNAGDLANPELRLAGVSITSPTSLGNPIISAALAAALDEERFNWLIKIAGADADGEVTIDTGFGFRDPGPTYRFANNDAPAAGGDPARWNPLMAMATITGESISAPPLMGSFTVPIIEEDGTSVVLELPLQNLSLQMLTLSEDRSCVGVRRPTSYSTMDGSLTTYITVADSLVGRVMLPPIDTSLCNVIAGQPTEPMRCETEPQEMWAVPPDSMCLGGTCTAGACAVAECNAWQIVGGFAAHGVEITP